MIETVLDVYEGNEPSLTIRFLQPESEQPFPLVGFDDLEFWAKVDASDDDDDALWHGNLADGVTITDDVNGVFVVQLPIDVTVTPRSLRYRVDTITPRVTRMAGPLIVHNV